MSLNTLNLIVIFLQREVEKVCGTEVFKLGLLFGCDDNNEDDDSDWVSFQHKIIHEFIAAIYIVDQVSKNFDFLRRTFPSWTHIKTHIEVFRFCCGYACEQYQMVFVNYFTTTMCDFTLDMMRQGWDRPTHVYTYKGDTYAERELELINHSDTQELSKNLQEILRECKYTDQCDFCSNDIFVSGVEDRQTMAHHMQSTRLLVFDEAVSDLLSLNCFGSNVSNDANGDMNLKQALLISELGPNKMKIISDVCDNLLDLKYLYLNRITDFSAAFAKPLKVLLQKPIESFYLIHSRLPEEVNDVVESLSNCVHLKVLNFWSTQGISHKILSTISNMEALTYFSLDGCDLNSEKCETLCSQLSHLCQLKVLELPYNDVAHHGKILSDAVRKWGSHSKLKRLNLVKCNMPADVTGYLLETLTQCCPQLYWLGLSGNDLGNNLDDLVKSHSSLSRLYISDTHLNTGDAKNLSKRIAQKKLSKLELLDISQNRLDEESLTNLAWCFKKYHKEEMLLNIGGNNLKQETIRKRVFQSRGKVKIITSD